LRGLGAAAEQRDIGTGAGQRAREDCAQAAAAAGDQGDPAIKPKEIKRKTHLSLLLIAI
jgi:hypothetical protein